MLKNIVFLCLGMMLCAEIAVSQRVKYKDLWLLLNAAKYEEAEPFLRTFLADPKNADEANAHLQMAFLLENKAEKNDLLEQNNHLITNCDSAIYFFGIAKQLITEKEVSKNDQYYQAYARRDLRTGKFGIKLSDVQYDIEKRVEALQNKKEAAARVFEHYIGLQRTYVMADSLFLGIQNKFSNQGNLCLMADGSDLKVLDKLAVYFDSARIHFNKYKENMESFPDSKYHQRIDLIPINKLEEVAVMPVDWKGESLKLRNYKEWSASTESVINGEVKSIKENIVSYNSQLDKLMDKIQTDSTANKNDLTQLVDKMIVEDLKKYDNDPMPLIILNFKVKRIEYLNRFYSRQIELSLDDELDDVKKRMDLVRNQIEIIQKASGYNMEEEERKYPGFLANFGGAAGMAVFVQKSINAEKETLASLEANADAIVHRMEWALNKTDSISLKPEIVQGSKYISLEVKDSVELGKSYVSGVKVGDEKESFVAFVNKKKEIDTLYTFKLDPVLDSVAVNDLRAITAIDPQGNCFSGFYVVKSDTVSHMDVNMIANKSIAWSNHITVPGIISRVALIGDRGVEIFIMKEGEEELKVKLDDKGKPVNQ